jgi:hypothetical protein
MNFTSSLSTYQLANARRPVLSHLLGCLVRDLNYGPWPVFRRNVSKSPILEVYAAAAADDDDENINLEAVNVVGRCCVIMLKYTVQKHKIYCIKSVDSLSWFTLYDEQIYFEMSVHMLQRKNLSLRYLCSKIKTYLVFSVKSVYRTECELNWNISSYSNSNFIRVEHWHRWKQYCL